MPTVLYEKDGRIARITLNRPEVMNAINEELALELDKSVKETDADPGIHVTILSGPGSAFCAGYDLGEFAQSEGPNKYIQKMPWDPVTDYRFMWENTQYFMSLWRAMKPVLCKIHGYAVAGGSDIALCADMIFMAEDAEIGYMPARVWGSPTTAMWVYRLGAEKAKRMLFTGDKISGREAEDIGLILKAVPAEVLDDKVEQMAHRLTSVPINQLAMQKMVINQAIEQMGLMQTQRLATFFDGISRHSPEGLNFKARAESEGWKTAVKDRDEGTFDWTQNVTLPWSNR